MVQHGLVLPADFLILICKGILCVKWSGHHILCHGVAFKAVGTWFLVELYQERIFIRDNTTTALDHKGVEESLYCNWRMLFVLAISACLIMLYSAQVSKKKKEMKKRKKENKKKKKQKEKNESWFCNKSSVVVHAKDIVQRLSLTYFILLKYKSNLQNAFRLFPEIPQLRQTDRDCSHVTF